MSVTSIDPDESRGYVHSDCSTPERIRMNSRVTALSSTDQAHLELMRLIDAQPDISQRAVAQSLGVSLGKANYCLRGLIQKGFVKAENYRNSKNKLAYVYLLTPSGLAAKAELTRDFLARKMREYERLGSEIERLKRETTSGTPEVS